MSRRVVVRAVLVAWLCGAAADAGVTQATPLSGSRELLSLYGVDDGLLDGFSEGASLTDSEITGIWRMIHAVRRFEPVEIERWRKPLDSWSPLVDDPSARRGEIVQVRGVLAEFSIEPPPAAAAEIELPRLCRCRVEIADPSGDALVFALAIPQPWLDEPSSAEGQRVSFDGFFLKLASTGERPQALFVAPRIAWHPKTPLGDLGMDVGLFDLVEDQAPLTLRRMPDEDRERARVAAERECFYAMLESVKAADPLAIHRHAEAEVERLRTEHERDVAAEARRGGDPPRPFFLEGLLFNRPAEQRGRPYSLTGTARRITRIAVDDSDIVERNGLREYFEVEIFTRGSQGNPIVICLRELPQGMPVGDKIAEEVVVAAFYMKKWSYGIVRPDETSATGLSREVQFAPLLIGRTLFWYPAESRSAGGGHVAAGVIATVALLVWAAAWLTWRRGRQARRKRGPATIELP